MPTSKKLSASAKKSAKKKTATPHHHRHAPSKPHHILFYVILFFVVFGVTYTIFSNFSWAGHDTQITRIEPSTQGTYTGVTPCADCPGINTTLTLNEAPDGDPSTYSLNLTYQDRDTDFTETGKWTLSTWKGKPLITLVPQDSAQVTYYEVLSKNQVRQLDGDRNPIPESMPFTLTKEE